VPSRRTRIVKLTPADAGRKCQLINDFRPASDEVPEGVGAETIPAHSVK